MTYRLALGEPVEGLVELLELEAVAQELLDRQASSGLQRGESTDVAGGNARAEVRPLERALLCDKTESGMLS